MIIDIRYKLIAIRTLIEICKEEKLPDANDGIQIMLALAIIGCTLEETYMAMTMQDPPQDVFHGYFTAAIKKAGISHEQVMKLAQGLEGFVN